ncbi:MAG: glycoside hydrolase family 130 protein [Saprospiraceae bacterium]
MMAKNHASKAPTLASRFPDNPLLTPDQVRPSRGDMEVECILNPGAFKYAGKTWLLVRVAERPIQEKGWISFPVMEESGQMQIMRYPRDHPDLDLSDPRIIRVGTRYYLTTLSHLRLFCSDDGIHFREPEDQPSAIFPHGMHETFGIEDCRVTTMNDRYVLTYTAVSDCGVAVACMETTDWEHFDRLGIILPPHNKDCTLFDEPVQGLHRCLHRPSGVDVGGNFIWIAESPDRIHWGNHRCIAQTRPQQWDSARVGAGAAPVKTSQGWLEIYHGADAHHRYCLGALLLDLDEPHRVLARSVQPIMVPDQDYEQKGFFGNVVFTNGHVVDGDRLNMYYGASDTVICGASFSITEILQSLQ